MHASGPGCATDDRALALAVRAGADRIDACIVTVDVCEIGDRDFVEFPANMAHFYSSKMSADVPNYSTIDLRVFVDS